MDIPKLPPCPNCQHAAQLIENHKVWEFCCDACGLLIQGLNVTSVLITVGTFPQYPLEYRRRIGGRNGNNLPWFKPVPPPELKRMSWWEAMKYEFYKHLNSPDPATDSAADSRNPKSREMSR